MDFEQGFFITLKELIFFSIIHLRCLLFPIYMVADMLSFLGTEIINKADEWNFVYLQLRDTPCYHITPKRYPLKSSFDILA